MLTFLADENFDNRILRGLQLWVPEVDLVRAQDVGLRTKSDEDVLEWAAQHSRIILTHDKKTMIAIAAQRIQKNLKMPGLIIARKALGIRATIGDLAILVNCGVLEDFNQQVIQLPL